VELGLGTLVLVGGLVGKISGVGEGPMYLTRTDLAILGLPISVKLLAYSEQTPPKLISEQRVSWIFTATRIETVELLLTTLLSERSGSSEVNASQAP
jgi:hypothetical protein